MLSTTEVLDRVLDKGIVIDAEVRIAVAGLELVTVNVFVKMASFETWERHAGSRPLADDRRVSGPSGDVRRAARPAAPEDTGHVRLRCKHGCTFERRATALVVGAGRLKRQRCAVYPGRRCAVTVI